VTAFYNEGSRRLQEAFDSRRLADRLESVKVADTLSDSDRAFLADMDMLFLATADAQGRPDCSYKGGDPGFVRVLDERTIAFPSYDGNGMFRSLGNALVNPAVGLLFISFARGRRLRVNGDAAVADDDPLLASWPGAQLVVRVTVREVFPNCPRYIHRYERVERSPYVPEAGTEPPVPDWKTRDWARDVLPASDQASGRA
jgi:predicted pyridoxine 5'-phosphate oxidase superfamily flavin-nucleotide-binding protein